VANSYFGGSFFFFGLILVLRANYSTFCRLKYLAVLFNIHTTLPLNVSALKLMIDNKLIFVISLLVVLIANAAGTNGLTCLPKHGVGRRMGEHKFIISSSSLLQKVCTLYETYNITLYNNIFVSCGVRDKIKE
jgi:hypothetical protein